MIKVNIIRLESVGKKHTDALPGGVHVLREELVDILRGGVGFIVYRGGVCPDFCLGLDKFFIELRNSVCNFAIPSDPSAFGLWNRSFRITQLRNADERRRSLTTYQYLFLSTRNSFISIFRIWFPRTEGYLKERRSRLESSAGFATQALVQRATIRLLKRKSIFLGWYRAFRWCRLLKTLDLWYRLQIWRLHIIPAILHARFCRASTLVKARFFRPYFNRWRYVSTSEFHQKKEQAARDLFAKRDLQFYQKNAMKCWQFAMERRHIQQEKAHIFVQKRNCRVARKILPHLIKDWHAFCISKKIKLCLRGWLLNIS